MQEHGERRKRSRACGVCVRGGRGGQKGGPERERAATTHLDKRRWVRGCVRRVGEKEESSVVPCACVVCVGLACVVVGVRG